MAQYAAGKQLPEDFLRALNISDTVYGRQAAIRIPYLDEHGDEIAVRYRLSLDKSADGDDRFRWKQGTKPVTPGRGTVHVAS